MQLIRYWFTFEKAVVATPLNLGCGVTARNLDDARKLISESMFYRMQPMVELGFAENISIASLEKNHVIPNMGSPAVRGIWFPKED